jgi:hypothetical protein
MMILLLIWQIPENLKLSRMIITATTINMVEVIITLQCSIVLMVIIRPMDGDLAWAMVTGWLPTIPSTMIRSTIIQCTITHGIITIIPMDMATDITVTDIIMDGMGQITTAIIIIEVDIRVIHVQVPSVKIQEGHMA